MVQLNFDASGVDPNTRPDPVPTNWYPVMITASEQKPTKAGTGSYLQMELTVQGGEFANRKAYVRLNVDNPNPQAVEIAYGELSAICHSVGMLQVQDSSQLHGKPFQAHIKCVERNDKPGEMSNEVAGYRDINGNEPGSAGAAPAQQQQAPQWANGDQQQQQQQQQEQQTQAPPADQSNSAPPWSSNNG